MSQKLDLNYPYGKFWRGIVRWSQDGKIDLKSEKGISQVNALLKVICHSPAFDCYDGNFNGLSPDAVVNSLNIDLDAEEYTIRIVRTVTGLNISHHLNRL